MLRDGIQNRGLLLVLSSPSGAGKTTLSRRLLEADEHLAMSVSVTTRPPRPGEVDGQDYRFVDAKRFEDMVTKQEFLEYATVFGNSYGTPRRPVEDALKAGKDILFDIDWQGTQQLSQTASDDLVKIFILPPTWEELERRLKHRGKDSEAVVADRMDRAADEISHWAEYDYVLINDDVNRTQAQIETILSAERLKRARQVGLSAFVKGLTS